MSIRQVFHLDDSFDQECLAWSLYENLDGTTDLQAPQGDWLPLTKKSDEGISLASLSSQQTVLAVRILLGGVKKESTKPEHRMLFQNLIQRIVGFSGVEQLEQWLMKEGSDIDGHGNSPSTVFSSQSVDGGRNQEKPTAQPVVLKLLDPATETFPRSDASSDEIHQPVNPCNHNTARSKASRLRILFSDPQSAAIEKIFYRDGRQVENPTYKKIYPFSRRIKKPRVGAVMAILCSEVLLKDGSTLPPLLSAQICRLLLEGIPRRLALTTGRGVCRERGELSEWRRMRDKLHEYYEKEEFRADFEGSSDADSESDSPNSLKRSWSVDDASENAPPSKRIKFEQFQRHPSTNPPSQVQTIKATRVSIGDSTEEEGDALRKGHPDVSISFSAQANSHSSSTTVSTSQAETSSQVSPATDKATIPNSRDIFHNLDDGSRIGSPSTLDSTNASNSEFLSSLRGTLQAQLNSVSQFETGTWSEESKKMVEDSRQTQETLLRAVSYACELETKLQTSEQKLQTSQQRLQSSEQRYSELEARLGKLKKIYDQFNAIFGDVIS